MVVTAETLTEERSIFAVNMKLEPVFRVGCGLLRTSEVVMDKYSRCGECGVQENNCGLGLHFTKAP
jgi:hypothetical protein